MTRLAVAALVLTLLALSGGAAHARFPTPQQTAAALADVLAASDFERLRTLISPDGFHWAMGGSGGRRPMSPDEAVAFLRAESGGRLQVRSDPRSLDPSPVPWGQHAMESTWTSFGNVPQQRIQLVLAQVGGAWYWTGGFVRTIAAPPPAAAPPAARPATLPSTSTYPTDPRPATGARTTFD